MKKIIFFFLSLMISSIEAQNNPVSFSTDPRIKYVVYQDNNVVPLQGVTFVTTRIKFGDKEEVLDIEGGDTAAWMVTYHPNLPNTVFVKPTLFNSNSNLTIITNQHSYYFNLSSNKKDEARPKTYALNFQYPLPKPTRVITPAQKTAFKPRVINTAYCFSGSPELLPKHVYDDGQFTYFELTTQGAAPAIFAVEDKNGKESTVNTRRSGKYLVVQRIAPQFTLRQGKLATSIFNVPEINRIQNRRRPQ